MASSTTSIRRFYSLMWFLPDDLPLPLYELGGSAYIPSLRPIIFDKNPTAIANDHAGFLARNVWHPDNAAKKRPDIRFLRTLESAPETAAA